MRARRDTKQNGELAEAAFLHKAVSLGLVVSKPFGPDSRYDFVVDSGTCLSRVQVRSVRCHRRGRYPVSCQRSPGKPLTGTDIEILAAYVIPRDAWYIVPVGAFAPATHIGLRPGGYGRFECYREAWHLLG